MLDLWPYKVGLKERVAAIEKELQAPAAKLAIRAAIGPGRHTIVQRLSASMDLAVIEFPSFDDLDAPLHGLVQLASHSGTLDMVLDTTAGDPLQKTVAAAQALADADRVVIVLLPVPRSGTPLETDAAARRHIEQMLAELVRVPSLRLAVLATPGARLRDGFTRTIELAASMIGAQQIDANKLPGEFGAAARALASWMAQANWGHPRATRPPLDRDHDDLRPSALFDRMSALISVLDDRYADHPERLRRLEDAVFGSKLCPCGG